MPGVAQLVAATGGATVLPDDGVVDRLAAAAVPHDHGLALVGDPDTGHVGRGGAGHVQRLTARRERGVPDLGRVVLNPPGTWEVLGELAVARPQEGAVLVHDHAAHPRRALVDAEDPCHVHLRCCPCRTVDNRPRLAQGLG
jgi:hypothetical protein